MRFYRVNGPSGPIPAVERRGTLVAQDWSAGDGLQGEPGDELGAHAEQPLLAPLVPRQDRGHRSQLPGPHRGNGQ